ncbi:hypothetical protein F4703DRAFT_1730435 [Phycomyces blakesleeanus]
MTNYEIVYAVHNFEAENEDEIAFGIGEPIQVLERDEKYHDGWWQGRNPNGEVGLFPMSYTSPNKPKTLHAPSIPAVPAASSSIALTFDEKLEDWDVEQVANWLIVVGLGMVADLFIEQEITGDILLDLTIDSLKELGITTYGKRYKVMNAINKLKNKQSIGETHESTSLVSRYAYPNNLSQSNSSESDGLYQYPRKAPLPPLAGAMGDSDSNNHRLSPLFQSGEGVRPPSFQSMNSGSNVSRTNTFNTTSSKKSSVSSGTADFALSVDPLVAGRPSLDGNSKVPEHEGWLYKQSDRYRTWNKRWFVLKGANLFYFKGPKDVRMKGIINLRGYRIIVDATIHAGKYSFKAQHERERTFFFYTDAKDSMRAWIQMLMKATITRDLSAPVMSSNHVSTIPLDVARRMRPRPPSVIMYKPQKPKQDAKMEMLEEEEETTLGPMAIEDDPSVGLQYRQTRESGVTVYPHHLSGGEIPEVPDLYQKYRPESKSETKQEKVAVLGDEDEDLIDPHHRQLRVSSSSDKSSSHSSFSATDFPKPWTRAQYIEWVNQHLPAGKHVVELTSAFRNGDALVLLLESLSHKVVRRAPTQKGGSVSMQMLDTIVAAFKFMGREGVVVDGRYTIKDVFGGNERKIMDMLDAIKLWAENNDFSSVATNEPAEKTPGWSESGMLDQRLATANRAEQALRRSMFEEEHEPIIF